MPVPEELQGLYAQLAELQRQLAEDITEEEWQAYKKVRDILRVSRTVLEPPTVPQPIARREAEAVGGAQAAGEAEVIAEAEPPAPPDYFITHPLSHACAMLGIFEPAQGEGTSTEYDAAAVERFAALGG